jgi:glutaredoxin
MGPTLRIYTMTHCPTCGDTRRMAQQIGDRIPNLEVEIVELDDPAARIPPEVFSVPTYVLNGDVISLGNPYIDQLEASIRRYELML